MNKILKYAVGIAISKDDFKACFSVIDEGQKVKVKASRTFAHTSSGCTAFLKWCMKYRREALPLRFLVEATGAYHEQLAYFLYQKGMKLSIILPNKAKKYLQSLGLKSKNDKLDAKGLAQMCAEKMFGCMAAA